MFEGALVSRPTTKSTAEIQAERRRRSMEKEQDRARRKEERKEKKRKERREQHHHQQQQAPESESAEAEEVEDFTGMFPRKKPRQDVSSMDTD